MQQANLIREFFDKVLCQQQFELLDNMMTENVVCIAPQAVGMGRVAVRKTFEVSARAFRSLKVDVQFAAEIGNQAAARICMRGWQAGAYAGIRNSGRRIALPCVYLFEFQDQRICKIEVYYDPQILASQIGNGQVRAWR